MWNDEHGDDFEVPDVIAANVPDHSWHNDECPRFGWMLKTESSAEDVFVHLWSQHPDDERRVDPGGRFAVAVHASHEEGHPISVALAAAEVPNESDGFYVLTTDDPERAVKVITTTAWHVFDALTRAGLAPGWQYGDVPPGR